MGWCGVEGLAPPWLGNDSLCDNGVRRNMMVPGMYARHCAKSFMFSLIFMPI